MGRKISFKRFDYYMNGSRGSYDSPRLLATAFAESLPQGMLINITEVIRSVENLEVVVYFWVD